MKIEKLSDQHSYVLGEHLAHARKAFELVSMDFSGNNPDFSREHVHYAAGVYESFVNSIARVISEREGGVSAFKDWTARETKPIELRGYLLEESVTTGILLGFKRIIEKSPINMHLAESFTPKRLADGVNGKNDMKYCSISGATIFLVESDRAKEAMQVLKKIREEYPLYY